MARGRVAAAVLGLALGTLGAFESGAQQPPGRRGCRELEELSLSQLQQVAVREADSRFRGLSDDLRNRLMARRLELDALLRDPRTSPEEIRAKAAEVFELRQGLEAALLDYSLELRAVLEPEQVRSWCPPGLGRGGRGGRRWSGR